MKSILNDIRFCKGIIISIFFGFCITGALWFAINAIMMRRIVYLGYFNYRNKIYSVELYDILDKPKKEKDD